ncbi:hypothetical protein BMS3Abin04_02514 [bacterium BMS3Abin04]|nr:hypothetical protein BMS3Abin04_02514 [bacterium BMS3Abin04]
MKKILLFFIILLFSANITAQDNTMKRYPFKSAVLSYKLSGDYEGIKTVYIDNYGNKVLSIWNGKYEKRQPGKNPIIPFSVKELSVGKLKYLIIPEKYRVEVSANRANYYSKNTKSIQETNDSIFAGLGFVKTEMKENINGKPCSIYIREIRSLVKDKAKYWIDKNYTVYKSEKRFFPELQILGSKYVETLENIKQNAKIDPDLFLDLPKNYLYQYVETYDDSGNKLDDKIFSPEEFNSIKTEIEKKGFNIKKNINVNKFYDIIKSYASKKFNTCDFMNSSGESSVSISFPIETYKYADTSGDTVEADKSLDFSLGYLRELSEIKDEHSKKGPFANYTLLNFKEFENAGQKTLYLVYIKKEEGEPDNTRSLLTFNFNGKYNVNIEADGKYSKDEMLKFLNDSKILEL